MKLVIILAMICLWLLLMIVSYSKWNKVQNLKKTIEQQQEELNRLQNNITAENEHWAQLQSRLAEVNYDIGVCIEKRDGVLQLLRESEERLKEQTEHAAELAQKQADLEKEKLKVQLEQDLITLQKNSPLEAYKKELAEAQAKIEVLHKQQAQELEKEDFEAAHSIEVSDIDKQDMQILSEISMKLNHRDALNKLIWSEYIQKPIQTLCKSLQADKVCGIYKITNKNNQMAYVGQAIDIGDRWKTHCKTALGIGSLSYLTNKFYKSMHKDGIDNYTFEILEACKKDDLDNREIYWMDFYGTVNYGYNTKRGN